MGVRTGEAVQVMCERCAELEETIIQLKKELGADKTLPVEWGLTRAEQKVMGIFIARGRLTYRAARLVLWHVPPDSCDDVIRRHVFNIRRKLKWFQITTIYGDGWEVDAENLKFARIMAHEEHPQ